jgi:hypothetical protein
MHHEKRTYLPLRTRQINLLYFFGRLFVTPPAEMKIAFTRINAWTASDNIPLAIQDDYPV